MKNKVIQNLIMKRSLSTIFSKASRNWNNPRLQNYVTILVVIIGPALAISTLFYLNIVEQEIRSQSFRAILLADVIYVITIASLVIKRIAIVVAARRAQICWFKITPQINRYFCDFSSNTNSISSYICNGND